MIAVAYLDELVWGQILELLRHPELMEAELARRRAENLASSPVEQRRTELERELSRCRQQMDKLLDAYQEELLTLSDLRERMPELKNKTGALEKEQQSLKLRSLEDQRWMDLNQTLENFLVRLNENAEALGTEDRQKLVRLLVKQIDVGKDTIIIHHSIPVANGSAVSVRSPLYPVRLGATSRNQVSGSASGCTGVAVELHFPSGENF